MALCNAKELLNYASKNKKAIGAFNVGSMEMVMGVIAAAEELNAPIIIQIAEVRLKHSPLHLMAPMMVSAAKNSKIEIAVQLDHGKSMDVLEKSLDYGFTSVMYDGSHLPLLENIEDTKKVVTLANKYGAAVEAELGVVGGSEDGSVDNKILYTNPSDVEVFCAKTGVTSMAVAIGNAHGNYKQAPKLNFEVLESITKLTDVPLVLHGGTGIPDEDFIKAIKLGVCKINIATSNMDALTRGAQQYFSTNKEYNYFGLNELMVETVYENTKKHINIFNN